MYHLRFGAFLAPYHEPRENPTARAATRSRADPVARRAWGSTRRGSASITRPGGRRSPRPRCSWPWLPNARGTSDSGRVRVSLPYHHPLMVADRIVLLDHLTRGRVNFGVGPGGHLTDAAMLGLEPARLRDMHGRVPRGHRAPVHRDRAFDRALGLVPAQRRGAAASAAATAVPADRDHKHGVACRDAAGGTVRRRGVVAGGLTTVRVVRSTWRPTGRSPRSPPRPRGRRSIAPSGAWSSPIHLAETKQQAVEDVRARRRALPARLRGGHDRSTASRRRPSRQGGRPDDGTRSVDHRHPGRGRHRHRRAARAQWRIRRGDGVGPGVGRDRRPPTAATSSWRDMSCPRSKVRSSGSNAPTPSPVQRPSSCNESA